MAARQAGNNSGIDTRTVGDVLDADAAAFGAATAPYDPKDEVRSPARARGPQRRPASEIDALLAPFVNDALAGVSDRLIAQRTGLVAQQVKHWRTRRCIHRRRGRRPAALGTQFLLASLLGTATEPVPHEISPVEGAWRAPVYALRRPLRYDLFVRAVSALATEMTCEEIALAVGIEERDVWLAIVLGAERGAT